MKPEYKYALKETLIMLAVAAVLAIIAWAPTAGADDVKYCKHRVTGEVIAIDKRGRCPAFYYPL